MAPHSQFEDLLLWFRIIAMASGFTPQEIAYETAHYQDNKGPAITGGSILLIIVATVAVFLRLLARRIKKTAWGSDDVMIVVALVGLIFEA